MRFLLTVAFLPTLLFSGYYGVALALANIGISTGLIGQAYMELDKYDKELKKTVELKRIILQAEISRDLTLSKKGFWINKIKNNLDRSFDINTVEVETKGLNTKILVYNTSMLYSAQTIKEKGKK